MKQTDEQIAKDYAKDKWGGLAGICPIGELVKDSSEDFLTGIQKGRQLERKTFKEELKSALGDIQGEMMEKALRFAEFICKNYRYFPWHGWIKVDLSSDENHTTEQLYNSKEFEYYLKQVKK